MGQTCNITIPTANLQITKNMAVLERIIILNASTSAGLAITVYNEGTLDGTAAAEIISMSANKATHATTGAITLSQELNVRCSQGIAVKSSSWTAGARVFIIWR